jgi:hypothetical protein
MHRLPKAAAVLLASTLASAAAFTIPDGAAFIRDGEALEPATGKEPTDLSSCLRTNHKPIQDRSIALITVEVPRSPDGRPSQSLPFRLDIFQSEEACGYANVTLDGQALPGDFTADQDHVATGSGSITTNEQAVIDATWSFHCVKVNGQPQMQFLKFDIGSLNGTPVEDIAFSVLFRQTGSPEVVNVNTDPSVPDELAANPNPWVLVADDDDVHVPQYSIDDLDELRQQLRELEYLIAQKEQAIANHAHERFEEDIKKCHGLKCIAIAAGQTVHHAAHKTYEKIRGHDEKAWDPFHKHDNHGKNEAWDPLHWKKPHHPLPICRFPHHEPSHPSKHRPPHPPHGEILSSPPPPSSNVNDTRRRTLLLHLAPLLILLFVFLLTIHLRAHRRTKSPSSRHQERRLRRTLRRRRPALLSRFFPPSPNDEKQQQQQQQQQQQLATAEEGHHLHNEITELRNAANLVGSLVSSPGQEEELPVYEDKDGF